MIFPANTYAIGVKRCWLLVAIIVLLTGATGCTGINRFLKENVLPSPEPSPQERLDKAQEAMRNKRYKKAESLYESLVQTKQKAAVIQEARYGLASISLLTANDLAQYREGLKILQTWAESSKQNAADEDPRYLMPLLEKRAQTLEDLQKCREDNKTFQKRIRELEETHNATLTKLQELRSERNQLRRKHKKLRREQKELRQKIRELENLYNELLDTREDL